MLANAARSLRHLKAVHHRHIYSTATHRLVAMVALAVSLCVACEPSHMLQTSQYAKLNTTCGIRCWVLVQGMWASKHIGVELRYWYVDIITAHRQAKVGVLQCVQLDPAECYPPSATSEALPALGHLRHPGQHRWVTTLACKKPHAPLWPTED